MNPLLSNLPTAPANSGGNNNNNTNSSSSNVLNNNKNNAKRGGGGGVTTLKSFVSNVLTGGHNRKSASTYTTVDIGDDTKRRNTQKRASVMDAMQQAAISERAALGKIPPNMLDPQGNIAWTIDIITLIALFYTAIVTPFEVAFLHTSLGVIFGINRLIDIAFLIDMSATFRKPYIDIDTGVYETNWKKIAQRYLTSWFFLDLVTLIPWDAISLATDGNFQAVRLLRLFRLLRLLRLVKLAELREQVEIALSLHSWKVDLAQHIATLLILAHWTSCLMGVIPGMEGTTWDDLTPEQIANGTVADASWITFYFENNLKLKHWQYDTWSIYLLGLYYAIMTLTTIGYGDVSPKTDVERGVSLVIMFGGAATYAYIVGAVCSILLNMDQMRQEYNKILDDLDDYMDSCRLPKPLRKRVKRYVHFAWRKYQIDRQKEYVNGLMPTYAHALAVHSARKWINKVPFFSPEFVDANDRNEFIPNIVMSMELVAFAPDEVIVWKGQEVTNLYVVDHGIVLLTQQLSLDLSLPANVPKSYGSILVSGDVAEFQNQDVLRGDCFGTDMFYPNVHSRTYAVTLTYATLFVLSREDLKAILKRFPNTEAKMSNTFQGRVRERSSVLSPTNQSAIAITMERLKEAYEEQMSLLKEIERYELMSKAAASSSR
jgi:CRP-like cAMP-binding protein